MNEKTLRELEFVKPDGHRLRLRVVQQGAYVGPQRLEIEGQPPWPPVAEIKRVDLSPDGTHVGLYAKLDDGSLQVSVDGRSIVRVVELLSRIGFSADSLHHAYTARVENAQGEARYVVIVDGQITHDEPYVFGFDAHATSPPPPHTRNLDPVKV